MRLVRVFGVAAALLLTFASTGFAQESARYAVLVQGASGDPEYATLHREWVDKLATVLLDRFTFDRDKVAVLAERPGEGEDRATAETVRELFGRLAKTIRSDDLLFVMMIGHGSGAGGDAKFNLVGPDLTATEWNALLEPIAGRLVVVDASSASFGFLQSLAAPGRVVITATNTPAQRYHTVFADAFVQALTADDADVDRNQRVSILEAFTYASRLVQEHYERAGQLPTEHALLDDTGKGEGRRAAAEGEDGVVAGTTYLDVLEVPTSSDPEMQKLLVRQRELTEQIDALRRRRPTMSDEEYEREFARLVTELAKVSQQIRERGGGGLTAYGLRLAA